MSDDRQLIVKCPSCRAEVAWKQQNVHRPFCSERCRNRDFIGWASEEHRIGGDSSYDDLLSDDRPPR